MKTSCFSLLCVALMGLLFGGCRDDKSGTFYGAEVHYGNGMAKTFVTLDEEGVPTSLGLIVPKASLDSLSHDPLDFAHNNISLPFAPEAAATGWQHVFLGWLPEGHEPTQVYDKPHFDVHFYRTTDAERAAIPPYEVDSSKFNILPAADYFPATYIRLPGGVPGMGVHWADVTSPELNGGAFTHTFIMGSYDSKMTFFEPMIARPALEAATSPVVVDIKPAAKYEAGYYPTQYSYHFDAATKEYKVTLLNLQPK